MEYVDIRRKIDGVLSENGIPEIHHELDGKNFSTIYDHDLEAVIFERSSLKIIAKFGDNDIEILYEDIFNIGFV